MLEFFEIGTFYILDYHKGLLATKKSTSGGDRTCRLSSVSKQRLTVNPRISPRGLIVNFEILHGGLINGGAYSREGAY